jgi:hypothetical protein
MQVSPYVADILAMSVVTALFERCGKFFHLLPQKKIINPTSLGILKNPPPQKTILLSTAFIRLHYFLHGVSNFLEYDVVPFVQYLQTLWELSPC